MRFNRYLIALRELGIEVHGFDLELMSIVAQLMGLERDYPDAWSDLYIEFISRTDEYERENLGNNLLPLAVECYHALINFKIQ